MFVTENMIDKKKILLFILLAIVVTANAKSPLDEYIKQLRYYRYSKHLDSTKFYFKKALPLALRSKDSVKIFYLYKNMGDGYEHHQHLDSTLLMYSICKRYIPKNDYRLESFLLNDTAYTYDLLHDYEKSTQLTLAALKLAEKSGDKEEIAVVLIGVADGFAKLKMNKQASYYYRKSILIGESTNRVELLDQAYRHYGVYLLNIKKLDLAYTNLKLANKCAIAMRDSISMAYSWYHLSEYYWHKKQIDSCFLTAKKAEKIWEARAENRDLSDVCLQQGSYYLQLNQLDKAEFYLKKAEHYILDDLYFNEKLYSNLANLYYKKGKLQLAFQYLTKSKQCNEKINEYENKSRVTSLRLKFETDKKELLIKKTLKDKEIATINAQKKSVLFKAVLVILFFVFISLIVIVLSYKKVKRNNRLLKKSNESLERLALQKRILLNEVHHRVKNNLTTLKSLLFLQAKSSKNKEAKLILNECQLRITSMALIHQNLYEKGESDQVHFNKFIDQLFDSLSQSYATKNKNITIDLVHNDISIDVSLAIPLGIILNELVTNSYKYAFDEIENGIIHLTITNVNNQLALNYLDNGKGLPGGFDSEFEGFGFKLIRILCQQINAKLSYEYLNNTSLFIITINDIN